MPVAKSDAAMTANDARRQLAHQAPNYRQEFSRARYSPVKSGAPVQLCDACSAIRHLCDLTHYTLVSVLRRAGGMFQSDNDIYATAPLQRLLDVETGFAAEKLKACSGVHGLLLGIAEGQQAPALLHVSHWARLQIRGSGLEGALRANPREALPFIDESFDVVVLQHALQQDSSTSRHLLLEAARVLAPGGMLAISGVHPFGGWSPWFVWNSREQRLRLKFPLHLSHLVRTAGLAPEGCSRVGTLWPSGSVGHGVLRSRPWGGGYVLLARKSRHVITPLRIKPIPVRLTANGQFSPGTRRNVALSPVDYVKHDE